MLVTKTSFGFKGAWKLPKKRCLFVFFCYFFFSFFFLVLFLKLYNLRTVQELDRDGPQPFKLAGIGGLSEFLG